MDRRWLVVSALLLGLAPAMRQIGQATKILVLVVAEGATCG